MIHRNPVNSIALLNSQRSSFRNKLVDLKNKPAPIVYRDTFSSSKRNF